MSCDPRPSAARRTQLRVILINAHHMHSHGAKSRPPPRSRDDEPESSRAVSRPDSQTPTAYGSGLMANLPLLPAPGHDRIFSISLSRESTLSRTHTCLPARRQVRCQSTTTTPPIHDPRPLQLLSTSEKYSTVRAVHVRTHIRTLCIYVYVRSGYVMHVTGNLTARAHGTRSGQVGPAKSVRYGEGPVCSRS